MERWGIGGMRGEQESGAGLLGLREHARTVAAGMRMRVSVSLCE